MGQNLYQTFFKQNPGYHPPLKGYFKEILSAKLFKEKGILDQKGNQLALYANDLNKLTEYAKTVLKKPLEALSRIELLQGIKATRARVIKYLSDEQLPLYELDIEAFNKTGDIKTKGGFKGLLEGEYNCIVYHQGHFYMHPKIRSLPGSMISTGISHTSFTHGKGCEFAGSLIHDGEGWILENASGHFAPRPTQLRQALLTLKAEGMDLPNIRVNWRVAKDKDNQAFDCYLEKAIDFLERTGRSIDKTTQKTDSWLASQALEGTHSASSSNPAGQPSDDVSDKDKRPSGHRKYS